VNGVSDNYVIGDGDDVVYRPVDFCLPVGPVFNFITGQWSASDDHNHSLNGSSDNVNGDLQFLWR